MALAAAVYLPTFFLGEMRGGRSFGPNFTMVYGFSQLAAMALAPVSVLSWVVALATGGRAYLRAGWWVGLAVVGGCVALGRSSLWF